MKKVFWSVEQAVWGADKPCHKWFDNLEEAQEYAKGEYTGKPVKHTYTTKKNIEEAEYACEMTRYER